MSLSVETTGTDKVNQPIAGNRSGAASEHAPGSNGHAEASPPAPPVDRPWTEQDSARLYGIQNWGQGYFSVNDEGHVVVHPNADASQNIDLKKLVDELDKAEALGGPG